ncbi:zinc-binding alcohol dehydrogenase [Candidatus Poribacteria bacterium]|nr:zinc-binding alcohol dehydrogenase [Candidatus Poribacteria bacterium]
MKAIVITLLPDKRREKIVVDNWNEPDSPVGNEVLCEAVFSGLTNGTERNQLIGGNYAPSDENLPCGGGYQNVGRVIEKGPDVTQLEVGDLIYASVDHVERFKIQENGLLINLSDDIEPSEAALFGISGVAMHCCRRVEPRIGERVLVVGQGCIGMFAAQIAYAMGARVSVCDIEESRLEKVRELGIAEQVINTSDDGWEKQIGDGGYDIVMDFAGVPDMVTPMIQACKTRGRLLLVAGRFDVKYTFNVGQFKEVSILHCSHFTRDDLDNLCRFLRQGSIKIAPLIQHKVRLEDVPQIYRWLRDEPMRLLGTVFEW